MRKNRDLLKFGEESVGKMKYNLCIFIFIEDFILGNLNNDDEFPSNLNAALRRWMLEILIELSNNYEIIQQKLSSIFFCEISKEL